MSIFYFPIIQLGPHDPNTSWPPGFVTHTPVYLRFRVSDYGLGFRGWGSGLSWGSERGAWGPLCGALSLSPHA